MRRWLKRLAGAVLVLALLLLGAGQAGMLRGTPPADLGVKAGRLKPPSTTPNSVSSQAALWPEHAMREAAQISPLPARADAAATMAAWRSLVAAQPGARVVEAQGDYLRAEFTTRWLQFVDDLELWFDPAAGVVQVRSASRLGKRDMDLNRARVETLRAAWAAGKAP